MSFDSRFHITIYPMRKRTSISKGSGVLTRTTETVPETTTFYASFFGATDFTAGARLAERAFFAGATVFLLCFTALFFAGGFATLVFFLSAAQRAFCAAAIRALPSALMVALTFFAGFKVMLPSFFATDPLGRPRRFPPGFVVAVMARAA